MLHDIFQAITPDNITDLPVLKDAMEIFTQNLENISPISMNINEMYNREQTLIREQLIKIYLDDLYRYFTKAETNPNIQRKIVEINEIYGYEYINTSFMPEITDLFTLETNITSRSFKEQKGTAKAIEHIYKLVESLNISDSRGIDFKFEEIAPFIFNVEGSLFKEFYVELVKPIAHPLGFTYDYHKVQPANFSDIYDLTYTYENVLADVVCLSADGTTNTQNFVPGMYTSNEVVSIIKNEEGIRHITRVTFNDGTYLEQLTYPIEVKYYNSNGTSNRDFTGHCSLKLSYDEIATSDVIDEITEFEQEVIIKENYFDSDIPNIIGDDLEIGEEVNAFRFHIGDWKQRLIEEDFTAVLLPV